jgi:hypothetical protein
MEVCVTAGRPLVAAAIVVWCSALLAAGRTGVRSDGPEGWSAERAPSQSAPAPPPAALFEPADTCIVCHNNLIAATGEDVSIGADWRGSMMANSARDPYWQAAVRRELLDHPEARDAIEDECSICHMPMTTFAARAAGGQGQIFAHLPIGRPDDPDAVLASDGVACAVCHQIQPTRLGDPSSFTGGYVIDTTTPAGSRQVFGPFEIDAGRARVMQSSAGFQPVQSAHVQQSGLCATCHTLFTHPLAPGATDPDFPEQTPYLEWQQSAYQGTQSCQSCHMPVVAGEVPVTRVLGQPRADVSRHTFRGGNFFMMRMLNRYRDELGVRATPAEMASAITRTIEHLREDTVRMTIARAARSGGELAIDVDIENLAGHKFPTGYPSRRAWLQLTVRDSAGTVVFESGAPRPDGSIAGNDNDADAARFEPHYAQITSPDQVQVYESMMVDPAGRVTTGLLMGDRYIKDNRLLPRGLAKDRATADVAVRGAAREDDDFVDGRDTVAYRVSTVPASGDLSVTATLWFQPIAFRWADNLRAYDAPETNRFVRYYQSMSVESALAVATATTVVR